MIHTNYQTLPSYEKVSQAKKLIGVSYLGGINISAKIIKNKKVSGHYTYIIYLASAEQSGYNVCPASTIECRLGCLLTSGRAGMEVITGKDTIKAARIKKTRLFIENPEFFMRWVKGEMLYYQKKALRNGFKFSARLNGTSDIDFSKIIFDGKNIFEHFPDVEFYDYTKVLSRFNNIIPNYYLTYSYTGRNWAQCEELLKKGHNVAMVFNFDKKLPLPDEYKGYKVINGDLTDARMLDAKGVIVGLYWKRIADRVLDHKIKNSIFAVQPDDINIYWDYVYWANEKVLEPVELSVNV